MSLSRWGIANPLPSALAFVIMTLAGFWGLRQLPISQLPDIALPTVQVQVTLAGATPSQLETDVTRKIEDSVASIADIRKINSAPVRLHSRLHVVINHSLHTNQSFHGIRS